MLGPGCWYRRRRASEVGTHSFDVRGYLFLAILRILGRHPTQQPVEAGEGSLLLQLLEAHEIVVRNDDCFGATAAGEDVRHAALRHLVEDSPEAPLQFGYANDLLHRDLVKTGYMK